MKYLGNHFISICLLSLFISCDVSSLSTEEITNLNKIGASITIQQDAYKQEENCIFVRLFDEKGRQIGNEGIKISVNNHDLPLGIRQELYYNKTIRYSGKGIPVSDDYYFELELSNDSIVPLGYIKNIPVAEKESIRYPKENSIDLETKIEWENLNAFDHLTIWKGVVEDVVVELEDGNKTITTYGGGPYAESTIHMKIEENGSYTVPTSFYRDSVSTITRLHYEFHVRKKGLMNPDLLEDSDISLTSSIEKKTKIE